MVDQHASYIFLKRGVYYYSRRIPSDLRSHYKTERIVFSLRTTCSNTAITLAQSASFKLLKAWTTMRLQDESIPGEFKLNSYVQEKQTESITLKDATSLYLNQKEKNRSASFKTRRFNFCITHNIVSFIRIRIYFALRDNESGDVIFDLVAELEL